MVLFTILTFTIFNVLAILKNLFVVHPIVLFLNYDKPHKLKTLNTTVLLTQEFSAPPVAVSSKILDLVATSSSESRFSNSMNYSFSEDSKVPTQTNSDESIGLQVTYKSLPELPT